MSTDHQQDDPTLIWAPDVIENVSTLELELYLNFSVTACIPGGGCSVEEALDVLYKCHGDIKEATKKLLTRETKEVPIWTLEEVQLFEHLFRRHPKNFGAISKGLKTKSVKDCVEFYYLRKQRQLEEQQQRSRQQLKQQHQPPPPPQLPSQQQQHYHYLEQHQSAIQIKHEQVEPLDQKHHEQLQQHQSLLIFQPLPNVIIQPQVMPQAQELKPEDEKFPCKVCGRIFDKIKSRSAHMKRHKNERLYNLS